MREAATIRPFRLDEHLGRLQACRDSLARLDALLDDDAVDRRANLGTAEVDARLPELCLALPDQCGAVACLRLDDARHELEVPGERVARRQRVQAAGTVLEGEFPAGDARVRRVLGGGSWGPWGRDLAHLRATSSYHFGWWAFAQARETLPDSMPSVEPFTQNDE